MMNLNSMDNLSYTTTYIAPKMIIFGLVSFCSAGFDCTYRESAGFDRSG